MNLTRQQELFLMQIGIQTLHERIPTQKEVKKKVESKTIVIQKKKHWSQTSTGRKRMSEIMRKHWNKKRKLMKNSNPD